MIRRKPRRRWLVTSFVLAWIIYLAMVLRLKPVTEPSAVTYTQTIPPFSRDTAELLSSVDYMACCGAGHRISKTADASFLAKQLGYSLRVFWGYCNGRTEVFHALFGPQPSAELRNVTEYGDYVRVSNDVPGFVKLTRKEDCTVCDWKKAAADAVFYQGLQERFAGREAVQTFVREQFQDRLSIGLHIRAGNGETGDFADRGRGIANVTSWTESLVRRLVEQNWGPAVVFLATDTPSMMDTLRHLLPSETKVVHWEQYRPIEGQGVLFGERGKVTNRGDDCIEGWKNAFMDMMILSHTDVVVAARPSSFTQSLPMSLVLDRPKEMRRAEQPFCEVNQDASAMKCYGDLRSWCCTGSTDFTLRGIQNYEYIKVPRGDPRVSVRSRPEHSCRPKPEGWKQACLPYDWADWKIDGLSVTSA